MNTSEKVINIHQQIQKDIYRMLPEKAKKICLYASMIEDNNEIRGEMFFYYFPAGILKKKPINVYEIPEIFSIDEEQYSNLAKQLYDSIKKLKSFYVSKDRKTWSNLTITIFETKYRIEFNYDDLEKSLFNSIDRHIIWRYKYLELPIESFNKEERAIIDKYFNSDEYREGTNYVYEENIYEKHKLTTMDYSIESNNDERKNMKVKKEDQNNNIDSIKNQLLNF